MKAQEVRKVVRLVNLVSVGMTTLFAVLVASIVCIQHGMIRRLEKLRRAEATALYSVVMAQRQELKRVKKKLEKIKSVGVTICDSRNEKRQWEK